MSIGIVALSDKTLKNLQDSRFRESFEDFFFSFR